jgi:hypothetical protein
MTGEVVPDTKDCAGQGGQYHMKESIDRKIGGGVETGSLLV